MTVSKEQAEKYNKMHKYSDTNYENKPQRVPNPHEKFMFFDDGKISLSRMYQAEVLRTYKPNEAPEFVKQALQDNDCDWIYAKDENGKYVTDVYIECNIPKYDDNHIWFARTKDGGFFSLDIQSGWQGGILDVDGRLEGYIESLND